VSPQAQAFLDANLVCLQRAFLYETTEAMTCTEVADVSFAAHAPCYLDSGVCDLSFDDQLTIGNAVEFSDLLSWPQMEAFADIAAGCML